MKEYDVLVIGSGAGAGIASEAVSQGLKVALVDKGPLGGTCLNVGCIPSKMLIYPADRVMEIKEAIKLGIKAEVYAIDFASIMRRMENVVKEGQDQMRAGLKHAKNLDLYEKEAIFVDNYTLEVGGEKIKGKKVFIASGARPLIPPIKGLDKVPYLTNENVLSLTKTPSSMIVIGGGYIATEFAHFFASMGTDVTVLQRGNRLLPGEEPEVSELLRKELEKRMKINLNTEATMVEKKDSSITVVAVDKKTEGHKIFTAQHILIATGRRSNADLLKVEKTGVKTDKRGYIKVNDYLETSKKNIWAIGDAIGRQMFRHTANEEADIAWHNSNAQSRHKVKMDYRATPHAVFTRPQIASVGLKEEEAKKSFKILVGKARYTDVAKGEAMMETDAFAKAIIEKETFKILGFHIIGPYAPILIQEVVNAMALELDIYALGRAMHIHPSLSEVVMAALGRLAEP